MPRPDPIGKLRARLERCSADIAEHVGALDPLYAERNDLYAQGVALGVKKVELAAWAGSTPDAVAKALKKLEDCA